jgi:hypothetical protein
MKKPTITTWARGLWNRHVCNSNIFIFSFPLDGAQESENSLP